MEEATWERVDEIRKKYLEFFLATETFEDESPFYDG